MLSLNYLAQYTDPGIYSDPTLTTTTTSTGPFPWGLFLTIWGIALVLGIITAVALWKIYAKAGKPGWAAIVPIYNTWVLFEIVGFPAWVAILQLVPFVNFVVAIMQIVAYYKLVKLFGKGDGFAVATIFFPFVTLPILAFSDAQFQGSPAQPANTFGGGIAPQQDAYQNYGQQAPTQPGAGQYPQPPQDQQPPQQQPPVPPTYPQQ